jgi:Methyltransferase domain
LRPLRTPTKAFSRRIPPIRALVEQRDRLARKSRRLNAELAGRDSELAKLREEQSSMRRPFPPGHYYSPLPDLADVRARADTIWRKPRTLPGIDLDPARQLALLGPFARYYSEQPFAEEPGPSGTGLRYGFKNRFYSYGDGLVLYCMLRHLAPRRLIEVGSGWSSALVLDVNDQFLDGKVECTFVEPYPDRLHELVRPEDVERVRILPAPLHSVDLDVFTTLEPGDVLLIDSTHVAKIGSDVNQLYHEVLPTLPAGVHVHVHDIFHPSEYPPTWVFGGRAWNEAYVLRAYLTYNQRVRVTWFNDYLATFHRDEVRAAMPLWERNTGGSIWLETL